MAANATTSFFTVTERRIRPNGSDAFLNSVFSDEVETSTHILYRLGKLMGKGYTQFSTVKAGFQATHPKGYSVVVTSDPLPTDTRVALDAVFRQAAKQTFFPGSSYEAPSTCVAAEPEPVPARAAARDIPDGTFTIVFDSGDYVTLRVETSDWDKSGYNPDIKTKVEFLAGSDNESDYQGFAFLDKATGIVRVWKRYQANYAGSRLEMAVHGLLADPVAAGETFALRSSRCWRCGRKLTVPASIHRGLGPDCAAKMGL